MKISRNDPCSCGSGKKYKKCCLPKIRANKANENKRTRDPDSKFVKYIDNEEELEQELSSLLEITYIQQKLFQDAILDQRGLKEQRKLKK